MSRLTQIQDALRTIDQAKFQQLCDAYLVRRGYKSINPIGLVIGKDKTAKGTPDTLLARDDGRYDLAEAMLAQDPQRLGPGGRDTIALHLAIDRKDGAAVRWLIERGVDVNAKRLLYDCSHTALHMCAERGFVDLAAELLAAGADTTLPDDKFAADALAWAEHCNRPDVAKLIRAHRAAEAPDA